MSDDLRKLQLEELNILKRFVDLCNENGLRYYLLGGTLLGAIRHQGFIPWDDDVDVCMPRKDYDRFLKLAIKELKEPLYLSCLEYDKKYRYCFARISTKAMRIRNLSANIPRIEDAWIDIIPMDGMPSSKIGTVIHKTKLILYRGLNQLAQYDELVDQKRKRSFMGTVVVKICSLKIFRLFSDYHKYMEKIQSQLKKYDYDNSEYVINYMAAYGFKETFKRSDIGKGSTYQFENLSLMGPSDYDSVLKTIYGDYMKLPPLSERNKHNSTIIDSAF